MHTHKQILPQQPVKKDYKIKHLHSPSATVATFGFYTT